MATRKKATSTKAAEAPVSVANEEVIENKDELVAEAAIDVVIEPEVPENDENKNADHLKADADQPIEDENRCKPSDEYVSREIVIINTSYNEILLNTGRSGVSVRIAPKEIKSIDRDLLRELLKNKIVRRWFDKGILTSNQDANETDANEAKAPENLKAPVERTDSVSTVSAKVTKFKKDGNVSIKL